MSPHLDHGIDEPAASALAGVGAILAAVLAGGGFWLFIVLVVLRLG